MGFFQDLLKLAMINAVTGGKSKNLQQAFGNLPLLNKQHMVQQQLQAQRQLQARRQNQGLGAPPGSIQKKRPTPPFKVVPKGLQKQWPEQEPPGPPPELPKRTTEEPLIGYRTWTIQPLMDLPGSTVGNPAPMPEELVVETYLVSPVTGTRWGGPIMTADGKPCPYDPHNPAWQSREDHYHGIYAHRVPCWRDMDHERAMGKVEMTGRVIVHEAGFRAEKARIKSLYLPGRYYKSDVKEELERRYQCDVSFHPTILEE